MNQKYTAMVTPSETFEKQSVTAGSGTTMQVLIGTDDAPNFAMRAEALAYQSG